MAQWVAAPFCLPLTQAPPSFMLYWVAALNCSQSLAVVVRQRDTAAMLAEDVGILLLTEMLPLLRHHSCLIVDKQHLTVCKPSHSGLLPDLPDITA